MKDDFETGWRRAATRRVAMFVLASLGLAPLAMLAFPYGLGVYFAGVIGGGLLLFRWHARHTAFRCPRCGIAFVVRMRTLLLTPHVGTTTLLRCPDCGGVGWCRATSRAAAPPGIAPAIDSPGPGPIERGLLVQMWIVLAAYALLWVNTWVVYRLRIEAVLAGPFPGGTATWTGLFLIPIASAPIPALAVPFFLYAARRGYRHPVYRLVAVALLLSLLVMMAAEYLTLIEREPRLAGESLTTRARALQLSPTISRG